MHLGKVDPGHPKLHQHIFSKISQSFLKQKGNNVFRERALDSRDAERVTIPEQ